MSISEQDVLRANINNETAIINWHDLQTFFAAGKLISVETSLSLLDVAVAFSQDNKSQVELWLCSGEIAKVSDKKAKKWHQKKQVFWANVVKPWILIQVK